MDADFDLQVYDYGIAYIPKDCSPAALSKPAIKKFLKIDEAVKAYNELHKTCEDSILFSNYDHVDDSEISWRFAQDNQVPLLWHNDTFRIAEVGKKKNKKPRKY